MEMLHKKAAIQKAFSKIGKSNGSAPPESDKNTFGVAYELFVSKDLKSQAEKRYEAAKQAAIDAGVIDMEKTVEGAEVITFDSDMFDVSLKQSAGSMSLDKTMLGNVLKRQCNLNEAQVKSIIEASSKPRKGAVNINISLKG